MVKREEFINLSQGNVSGEESNLRRRTRNLKRGKPNEKTIIRLRREPQIKMVVVILRAILKEVVILELLSLLVLSVGRRMIGRF